VEVVLVRSARSCSLSSDGLSDTVDNVTSSVVVLSSREMLSSDFVKQVVVL
jgi:hypothetical protein